MASTVEPCETKPLGSLSSTLEIFDTFKTQDDDKDSDEESFHLPLLGCDDETENGKEETTTPIPETEDEILNKFESSTPELVDTKTEESLLLNEDDNEKAKNKDSPPSKKESDTEEEIFHDLEIVDEADGSFEETNSDPKETTSIQNESDKDSGENVKNENRIEEIENCEEQLQDETKNVETESKVTNIDSEDIGVEDAEIIELKTDEKIENEDLKVTSQENGSIDVDEKMDTEDVDDNSDQEIIVEKEGNEKKVISNLAEHNDEDPNVLDADDVTEDDDQKIIISDSEDVIPSDSKQTTLNTDRQKVVDDTSVLDHKNVVNENSEKTVSSFNKDTLQEHSDENEKDIENIAQKQLPNEEIESIDVDKEDEIGENQDNDKDILAEQTDSSLNLEEKQSNLEDQIIKDEIEPMEVEDIQDSEDNSESTVLKPSLDKEERAIETNDTNVDHVSNDATVSESAAMDVVHIEDEDEKLKDLPVDSENKVEKQVISEKEKDTVMDIELLDDHKVDEYKDSNDSNKHDNHKVEEHNDHTEDNHIDRKKEDNNDHKKEESKDHIADEESENQCAKKDKEDETMEKQKETNVNKTTEESSSHDEGKTATTTVSENESEDATSHKNIECDDLLDISVIRDADEDNANAIAEITETPSSEKSDNDEQDEKEHEMDEVEEEQEDTLLASDKDERMEFDEGNTNSCDQDTSTTDNIISDSDNKENDALNSESESQHTPSCDDVTEMNSNQSSVDTDNKNEDQATKTSSEETDESVKPKDTDKEASETAKDEEDTVDKSTETPEVAAAGTAKRQLPEGDQEAANNINKKMRLSDELRQGAGVKKPGMLKRKPDGELKRKLTKRSIEERRRMIEDKRKAIEERKKANALKGDKIKTLVTFEKFMKNKNMGEGKLTRSDLEQFCLQKICEALIHKTDTGELHQTIKKQEQIIDNLRKDLLQLSKQTRDLDIVNKKLMNELRTQNINQKPLVPLKITRSVGLQVKLNIGSEVTPRRKPQAAATASTPVARTPGTPNPTTPTAVNRSRTVQSAVVARQMSMTTTPTATSPRKTPTPAPILTQALQTRPPAPATVTTPPAVAKRPPAIRPQLPKQATPGAQAPTPGVIDLTDEDDRSSQTAAKTVVQQKPMGNKIVTPIKIVNKNNVNVAQNKTMGPKGNQKNTAQPKTVAVGQVKTQMKPGMQPRAMTAIPQSVRLTSAQLKNGITIPGSVVTSTAGGTTQLMYVVQPTGTAGNTGAGVQKAVLLNFQPTNGVLTSTINGSAVSVIPSKNNNSMQLKTLVPRKHPAPLPMQPPSVHNSSLKPLLPRPHLSIRKTDTGIILQWRMPYNLEAYESIASYQLFAYQETNAPPSTDMWRKVGDVKALALPMACTLTQFADKNKYYFAVRSVDVYKRIGAFSDPEEISL